MSRGKRVESNSPSKPNRCIVCVGSWRFCCTYSFTCHNYNRLRITRENVGRVKQTPAHIWRKWKLYRIMDDIQGWKGYCIFFLSFRIHCNSSQPAGGFIIKAGGIALQTTLLHWPPPIVIIPYPPYVNEDSWPSIANWNESNCWKRDNNWNLNNRKWWSIFISWKMTKRMNDKLSGGGRPGWLVLRHSKSLNNWIEIIFENINRFLVFTNVYTFPFAGNRKWGKYKTQSDSSEWSAVKSECLMITSAQCDIRRLISCLFSIVLHRPRFAALTRDSKPTFSHPF